MIKATTFQLSQQNTVKPPIETKPQPLRRLTRSVVACYVSFLIGIPSLLAAAQPALPDLLKALSLSDYPVTLRPPDFTARTTQGPTISLSTLEGRVVLLNFWASWCAECRPEMTMFEQLHREFAAQGLAVLGINVREGSQTIQRYATAEGLSFPLVMDPNGKIFASYGVIGLPTTFLIGRDGRPVALAVGPRDWASAPARAIIEALLAEPQS